MQFKTRRGETVEKIAEQEKEAVKKKDLGKQKKKHFNKDTDKDVKELLSDKTISKTILKALKFSHQTQIKNTHLHQARIYVVFDCYIIGTEPVKRLNRKR